MASKPIHMQSRSMWNAPEICTGTHGRECIPATSANNTESSPSKKDLQLGKNSAPRDVDESRSEGVQDLSSAGH
ncbi:hypothetical protein M404DRAFT_994916 [Pisolithus tinctorius Marx 270]|uniref:Uncharacterized protein n=1 Tax=Pisolithus tinctorius Marx 270 TaxID=870435 RepID=A0A0C3JPY2_PISTI|nr:hypothetical protein M404DRAFT_994916 [Pisolithus tinctorius Marx 270]